MIDKAKLAGVFVRRKITELSENKNGSAVRAALARLRRGIGKAPGSMPELWSVTLDGLPEPLLGKGNIPSPGEWAVHTALTLYALHQQGKDLKKECMNRDGESLGAAVRNLAQSDEDRESAVTRRFNAAATSDSFEEFSRHLRGLVELLKSENLPLDYPSLAEDLYRFQFPEQRDGIRLKWGQDFYHMPNDESQDNEA